MEDSESQFIGRLAIILFCLFPILSQANSFSAQEADMLTDRIISFADDEVKERLQSLGEDVVIGNCEKYRLFEHQRPSGGLE